MRTLLRPATFVASWLVLFASFVLALPLLGGPRVFADLHLMLIAEPMRGDALAARARAVRLCHDGKREVTLDLIAGRLTLSEAADRFVRLDADLNGAQPGADRAEAIRAVLGWVRAELPGTSPDQGDVLARLEREGARLEAACG